MYSPPAAFPWVTAADLREWRALSNMEPICPVDTELKAGDGFKKACHKRYFIRKKKGGGGFGLAGGGTIEILTILLMKVNTHTVISG